MEKKKNTPKLRFPEFKGEWEEKKLGEIATLARGKSKHRPRDAEFLYGGKYPFIQTGDIRDAGLYLKAYSQTYSDAGLAQSKLWDENTLCITIAANIAETTILKIKACFPDSIIGLIPIENEANVLFVKAQFDKYKIDIQKLSQGAAQANLNQERLSNLVFSFPALFEQTKIATFLTAVDEKLTQLKKKKTLLEQYKKGVMQKLFSQELRFKDDNNQDFPDWQEKTLGEISKNVMYGMNSSAIAYDGINKYLRITDIDEDSRKFIPNPLTSPEGDIENKYKLNEGDLVFARTGASVGKSYLYNKSDGNLLFAGFLIRFAIQKENPYFIYLQTIQDSFKKWVQLMSMRSGQPGINAEEYKTLILDIPSLPEQQKIATFLSAIDEKINHCSAKIEKMETWKKGLLQQMFC